MHCTAKLNGELHTDSDVIKAEGLDPFEQIKLLDRRKNIQAPPHIMSVFSCAAMNGIVGNLRNS